MFYIVNTFPHAPVLFAYWHALCCADGGVFMHDRDRDLSYFFPGCKLDQWEIMHRYNNNLDSKYSSPTVDEIGMYKLIDEMIAASLA
jgi:hypothetical protein